MKRLLPIALLAVALTACGTAAAQTEPFNDAQYLADIQAEATRSAQLNDRTEALLDGNEVLQATAIAAYASMGADFAGLKERSAELGVIIAALALAPAPAPQPTPVPPTPVVIVQTPPPFDQSQITEPMGRTWACANLFTMEVLMAAPYMTELAAANLIMQNC